MKHLTIDQVIKGMIVFLPLFGRGKVVDIKKDLEALVEFEVKTSYEGKEIELMPEELWMSGVIGDPFEPYSFRYLFRKEVYICEAKWFDYITEEGDTDSKLVFEPVN